jgi:hypothetical protein
VPANKEDPVKSADPKGQKNEEKNSGIYNDKVKDFAMSF